MQIQFEQLMIMVEPIERLAIIIIIELIVVKPIDKLKIIYFALAKFTIPKLIIIELEFIELMHIEELRHQQELGFRLLEQD